MLGVRNGEAKDIPNTLAEKRSLHLWLEIILPSVFRIWAAHSNQQIEPLSVQIVPFTFMWMVAHVENVLFRLGGDWRRNTSWCLPCGAKYRQAVAKRFEPQTSSPDVQAKMLDIVYEGCGGHKYYPFNGRKTGSRYRGLNLCPWLYGKRTNGKHQTVEFRMHENTTDADRVIQWTHLLVRLVDWVKKSNDKQAQRLSKDPVKALCKIAPQSRKWIIGRLRGNKPLTPPQR